MEINHQSGSANMDVQRILAKSIPMDHYQADATIVWCFDHRFSGLLEDLRRINSLQKIDLIKIAGGAKSLTIDGPAKDFVLGQIEASIRLHKTKRVVLMNHSECGAYGRKFKTPEEERIFHKEELAKAAIHVQSSINPSEKIEIVKIFADQEGLIIV